MITIVTGDINAGKTTALRRLYETEKIGDGFLSVKAFEDDHHTGYDAVRLSDSERILLARKGTVADEIARIGAYSFSRRGIETAQNWITDILNRNIVPVYLDEIGPLELRGEVFAETLRQLIRSGAEGMIAVRRECVDNVIRVFDIRNAKIIDCEEINRYEING